MLNSSYLFLPFLFLVLFIAVFITNKVIKIELPSVKYAEIDGVRGFLAFLCSYTIATFGLFFLKLMNGKNQHQIYLINLDKPVWLFFL